jgi:small subunit ribosomal protein S20
MATHKSSEKRARQTIRRNKINRARRASIHTTVKAVDAAIAAGDKEAAVKAQRGIRTGAQFGPGHAALEDGVA